MTSHSPSFLDLTAHSELRPKVISPDAVVVFASGLDRILWANAAGAALFGGSSIADLIDTRLSDRHPLVRQLQHAARQIDGVDSITRRFKVTRGLKTESVESDLSSISLPDGSSAVLLVSKETGKRGKRREYDLAQDAIEALEGFVDASAILDEFGLTIAASSGFDDADIDPDLLEEIAQAAFEQSEPVLKKVLDDIGDGPTIAGIARLKTRPGRLLVILADDVDEEPGETDGEIETSTAASAAAATAATGASLLATSDEVKAENAVSAPEEGSADYAPETVGSAEETKEDAWRPDRIDETATLFDPLETDQSNAGASSDEAETTEWLSDADLNPGTEETRDIPESTAEDDEPEDDETESSESFETLRKSVDSEEGAETGRPSSEDDIREFDTTDELTEEDDEDALENALNVPSGTGDREQQAGHAKDDEPETGISDNNAPGAETDLSASDTDEMEAGSDAPDGKQEEPEKNTFTAAGAAASAITAAAGGFLLRRGKKTSEEAEKAQSLGKEAEAARFAFTTDEDQVIQSVSGELASVVGERSANIVGQRWEAIARTRGFDEDGTILSLLRQADTWSGKTVLWPIDGTDMCVPIDLAALPVFGRDRSFEGFRGFGMIRAGDKMVDPGTSTTAPTSDPEDQFGETCTGSAPANQEQASHDDAEASDESADESITDDNADRVSGPLFGPYDDEERAEDVLEASPEMPEEQDVQALAADYDPAEPDNETSEGDARSESTDTDNAEETEQGGSANVVQLPRRETGDTAGDHDERWPLMPGPAKSSPFHPSKSRSGLSTREHDALDEIRRSLTGSEFPTQTDQHDRFPQDPGSGPSENAGDQDKVATAPEAETGSTFGDDLLTSLPVPLLIYRTGGTLFANRELLDKAGYASIEELRDAGGIDALFGISDEALGEDGQHVTLQRKDGSSVPVRSRLRKVDWEGKKALCLTFEQIERSTAQKSAWDMIRVSELENILETAADGILVLDGDGRIESINASGEALFNRRLRELQGYPFKALFANESQPVVQQYLSNLAETGISGIMNQGQEVLGHKAKGGVIPLFLTLGKIGETDRICAVLRDLSSWKKSEEELVKARRSAETASEQKSQFLSRMSHEIREPLNAIIGFSDVMIDERFGPINNYRYKGYLKDINRSGIHVLDLVNDLLDISKIEAGKLELSYEAVDLNQLAAETVALLQPQANGKRIIIRTSLSRAVPKVVADARSIRQIILNLVSNAIKHSPRNSQVIVSTIFEENGEVGLRIRDTGRGMTEAELTRALEPFSQLGDDRMERGGGSGLGLPLTKALVEANRAYFELESEPGEGTIAHIQFPSQRVLAD